ncbi:MAG: Hydroxypyruvate reductase [Bacteroidia bacterium]|nr:phosphoglycerate dehydrogenase [Zoogloeaceae bacterium]MCG3168323.1 Hydroxypyruvate reductase [Bacteroidia bacterium]MCK6383168.1 phosphoglycerate dehydrogenase [Rhodocyclaceae bacterium]
MPKVLITTSSFNVAAAESLALLGQAGYEIVTNPHGRKLTEDEAAALLGDDMVGMIAGTEPLTRRVLSGARGLKIVSRCGIGLDSVDLAAAAEFGIEVTNTPDAPSAAVAELTLGLMLDQLRRISQADRQIRTGQWKPLMGGLLAARAVGIVGYGRIGRRVAKLAQAFGARVLATDAAGVQSDGVAEPCALERLLTEADIVTLHMPSQKGAGHFLDAARLGMMKRGAVLVNTARGGLVDEAALAQAIRDGRLGGAALDTYEKEPYAGPLAELPQVVLTAHMGSYAEESRGIMEREAADNLYKGLAARGLVAGRTA